MKRTVQLFPHMVLRIAGDGFDAFAKTELDQTIKTIDERFTVQEAFDVYKEKLSEELHPIIGKTLDPKKRNVLIKARRDIYNGKQADYLTADIIQSLPKNVQTLLSQTVQLLEESKALTEKAKKQFLEESKQSKKAFTKLLDKQNFQNGLVLSSNTLLESVKKYKELHDTHKQFPKIERSLAKYLSRMYTKPTPFSTFTQLAGTKFSDNPSRELFPLSTTYSQASFTELNHALYHYLFGLLIQNGSLNPHFPIKVNNSIRVQGDQFVFVTNNFNRESFQRITITPALEYIFNLAQTQDAWNFEALVTKLIDEVFTDTPKAELQAYIEQLLLYGFMEYDFGISGLDREWDKKLAAFLKPLAKKFEYILDVIKTLQSLRTMQQTYTTLSPVKRETILRKTFRQFRNTCKTLHKAAGLPKEELASFEDGYQTPSHDHKHDEKADETFKHEYDTIFNFKPQNLLFEDSYVEDFVPVSNDIKKNLDVLGNMLNSMEIFDRCVEDMYKMTAFFKSTYKEDAKIDLLEFYEAYYRNKKDKEQSKEKEPLAPNIKAKRAVNDKLIKQLTDKLKKQLQTGDEIKVTPDDLAHIPIVDTNKNTSYGALFQAYDDKKAERVLVMNSFIIGYGRMMTRFLPFFPKSMTSELFTWNQRNNSHVLLAEGTDSSSFNANLHPRLTPYEISMPGSYNELPKEQQIDVKDLDVTYNGTVLELWHRQLHKRVFVFDLGFQGLAGRSELYTFLSKFSLCEHHNAAAIINPINEKYEDLHKGNEIIVHPRIWFGDAIMLQRKSWDIPTKHLPKRDPQDSDWNYFLKVNTWRNALHIPTEIFIHVNTGKPQYISFANPLLIPILEKTIEKLKEDQKLSVVEMSPTTDQLHTVRGEKTVTEFFAQWYY